MVLNSNQDNMFFAENPDQGREADLSRATDLGWEADLGQEVDLGLEDDESAVMDDLGLEKDVKPEVTDVLESYFSNSSQLAQRIIAAAQLASAKEMLSKAQVFRSAVEAENSTNCGWMCK